MIKTSITNQVGATIQKTKQTTLQADGTTPLTIVGEVHLTLSSSHLKLQLDALLVDDLDVDVLAGTPFMITDDISVRPSRQQITIKGSNVIYYGSKSFKSTENHIRCTQALVIRAPSSPTMVWLGNYLELDIPANVNPDTILTIEPHPDYSKAVHDWPCSHILEAIAGKVRVCNDTNEPKSIAHHEHFCQVHLTHNPMTIFYLHPH